MATVFFDSTSELATLTNVFTVAGVDTDPTTVTLTVTSPTGNVTTPSTTHAAAGTYTADITCNEDGEWQYLWEGTGTATDAEAGTWTVLETALGKLYCPIRTLKSRLKIEHNQVDYELHAACFAASRWIEQHCERVFYRTTSTARTFEPDNCYTLRLPEFCDLVTVTSIKTDTAGDGTFATTLSASDYEILPRNPLAAPEQLPYTEIRRLSGTWPEQWAPGARRNTIQVTGVWGWPKVPHAVRQAAAIVAADTFALKDAPFGVEGAGEFTIQVGENARALKFLAPYRRNPVLVA